MRARVMLPLLVLAAVALTAAGCGPTSALAGAAPRPPGSVNGRLPGRSGPQALGATVDTAPLRLLFVGASVTQGWFASSKERTYTALVAKGLGTGRRVRIRIMSRPGVTAEQAADWDLDIPSDVVVVQIATNDFVKDVPVDDYSAAYAELLDRLRMASPRAELICMGAWSDPTQKNRLGAEVIDYNLAARTQCEAVGGHYVDIAAAYLDAQNHGPPGRPTYQGPGDVFHPNDAGHAALAELVLAADGVPERRSPAR